MPDEDDFDKMLRWLDPERGIAAERYEQIRTRLIRIFVGRNCWEAEELADRTLIRVSSKAQWLLDNYQGDQNLYFYGVANNVHHEWNREKAKLDKLPRPERPTEPDARDELLADCLEACLGKLIPVQRRTVLEYFRKDERAKIEHRKQLAIELGITINALHIRVCRIKTILEKCINDCVLAGAH